jgi:hypothetical protein
VDAGAKIQSFSKRKEKKRVFCKQPLCTIIYLLFSPDNLCTPVLTLEVGFAERFGFWVVIRQIAEKARWNGTFLKITAAFSLRSSLFLISQSR